MVAKEKNKRFSPEGCSRNGPLRFMSCSYTSSGSGRLGPLGLEGGTLRAYGEPALPISGFQGLFPPPSCRLYLQSGLARVGGGWGRSFHSMPMNLFATTSPRPLLLGRLCSMDTPDSSSRSLSSIGPPEASVGIACESIAWSARCSFRFPVFESLNRMRPIDSGRDIQLKVDIRQYDIDQWSIRRHEDGRVAIARQLRAIDIPQQGLSCP